MTGGQVPCHIDTFFFMEYNEFNSGNIYGGSPHFSMKLALKDAEKIVQFYRFISDKICRL